MALVMAVMLKYFIIEAYKIPTGSMQPTLLGNDDTNIYDRILVDKLSYHFRDPERFEVAVFRYPLDRSKNFIKRIVGMPGEDFRVLHGDLWARRGADEPWEILRRPPRVQQDTWKELAGDESWRIEGASRGWETEGNVIRAQGEGAARFPATSSSIRDRYTDGYPGKMADRLRRTSRSSGTNDVGDLRVQGRVAARADCEAVVIELMEGFVHYRMTLPGPAAAETAVPTLTRLDLTPADGNGAGEPVEIRYEKPWKLSAKRSESFSAQNLDDRVELEIAGSVVLSLDVAPVPECSNSRVRLATEAGGATFEKLRVFRDIYYTNNRSSRSWWTIPEGHYFMMGDNTQDSADSREWHFARYSILADEGPGELLRGNSRERENPVVVQGAEDGPHVFFRDEWGERHVFTGSEARRMDDEVAPFVPRDLFTGRALIVFWPFVPSLDVWRLKWIR
jgi:hypothetical protein